MTEQQTKEWTNKETNRVACKHLTNLKKGTLNKLTNNLFNSLSADWRHLEKITCLGTAKLADGDWTEMAIGLKRRDMLKADV